MADNLSRAARKRAMTAVKSANTAPELKVRSALHRLGYRFRPHNRTLPGNPDLALARLRLAVFVHGCFWHGHPCLRGNRLPKTNADYWKKKITGNVNRDRNRSREYQQIKWRTLVIWECQIKRKGFENWIARKLRRLEEDR